jgi:hypothetical protein
LLGFDEHGEGEGVVVGGEAREVAGVVAQFEAEAAEMAHPARFEVLGSAGGAGSEHAEQVVS